MVRKYVLKWQAYLKGKYAKRQGDLDEQGENSAHPGYLSRSECQSLGYTRAAHVIQRAQRNAGSQEMTRWIDEKQS
jgi:hypothetical protein